MQKPVQFWYVSSLPSGELQIERLSDRVVEDLDVSEASVRRRFPKLAGRALHGRLEVKNEYFISVFLTADKPAHERFVREGNDRVARTQEHMLPPVNPYALAVTRMDELVHIVEQAAPDATLCGETARGLMAVSEADRCEECVRRAGPAGLALGHAAR